MRWENDMIWCHSSEEAQQTITAYGEEGWELVSAHYQDGTGYYIIFYFLNALNRNNHEPAQKI
jgi:hypothetical protein